MTWFKMQHSQLHHAAQRQKETGHGKSRGLPESKNHSPHVANNEDKLAELAFQLQIKEERITMLSLSLGEWVL